MFDSKLSYQSPERGCPNRANPRRGADTRFMAVLPATICRVTSPKPDVEAPPLAGAKSLCEPAQPAKGGTQTSGSNSFPPFQKRPLGTTGLHVSEIALGSVSLGIDYGIRSPGQFGRPDRTSANRVIRDALDAGLNFVDTAPAYGDSERLLGEALGANPNVILATKVAVPKSPNGEAFTGKALRESIQRSLENSLRSLRRDVLDIVQIHNATLPVIRRGEFADALNQAVARGKVRFIGASVYTEEEALAALQCGGFQVLQVPFSLLDPRMADRVFATAQRQGVGLIVRSALLKGVLTPKAQFLPPEMSALKSAALNVAQTYACGWFGLPKTALRFCLSFSAAATVLVGARTSTEIAQARQAALLGPLCAAHLAKARNLRLTDEHLFNPCHWPIP